MGLPGALGSLPLAPIAPEYGELMRLQYAAGLAHFGEVLVGDGETLSVLDGLFLCVGNRRHHLGAARLRALADANPSQGPLLRLLADIQTRDASALRRVLLHQLIGLLQEPGARRKASGLDPAEAALLELAVAALPVLDARQRKAAESLGGLWQQRRLRAAARALDAVGPAVVRADPALAHLASRLGRRLGRCDRSLAAARAAQDTEPARTHYLDALRTAADDDTATRGLIKLERPRRPGDAPLTARLSGDRVLLAWPVPDGRSWRAVRLTRGTDRPAVVPVTAPAPGARGTAVDHGARRGTLVRYAVFPLLDGVPDGPPLVSAPLLVAPDAEDLTVTDAPARLTARWTLPPGTARATVLLHAADGPEPGGKVLARHDAGAHEDMHTFTGLRPGSYLVRVVCHHSSPEGREVESAGARAAGVVHAWPEAVTALTAEPDPEGGVRFAGAGADGAEVRLVTWSDPAGAPPEGTGLPVDALPAALPWAAYGTAHPVAPPSAFTGRVVAVAIRGERAVVGPAVRVDIPAPVTGLRGLREHDGQVRLVFDWPSDAGSVEVEWEQAGARDRSRVSRSRYLREGLRLPIGPAAVRIGVRAASRHERPAGPPPQDSAAAAPAVDAAGATDPTAGATDTTVVRRAPAVLDLPGDVVVSFRLVTRRRGLARRVTAEAVEVTVTGVGAGAGAGLPGSSPDPDGAGTPDTASPSGLSDPSDLPHPSDHPGLPDLVLVARAGDAATARPRHPEDGDVLVRLTGAELAASPRTVRELPAGPLRPPYALRAFLAGRHAGSVRLEEPALSTLVVR
ncbi:hypothetical protein [Streptomyces sp. NPDC013489]|uniref:hypothetical protein n=1 Tax=Streptomyces sp. NPDC013489 TaxID=3155606 RepID=UPI0033C8DEFE